MNNDKHTASKDEIPHPMVSYTIYMLHVCDRRIRYTVHSWVKQPGNSGNTFDTKPCRNGHERYKTVTHYTMVCLRFQVKTAPLKNDPTVFGTVPWYTRCGAVSMAFLRCGSLRFSEIVKPTVRSGAVVYRTVRFGAVLKNRKSYGEARCGFQKSSTLRCGSVLF